MSQPKPEHEYNAEFAAALERVFHDVRIDGGAGADLVAVGVQRSDCIALLRDTMDSAPDIVTGAAIAVQSAVAVGVWIERARWENNELPSQDDT